MYSRSIQAKDTTMCCAQEPFFMKILWKEGTDIEKTCE